MVSVLWSVVGSQSGLSRCVFRYSPRKVLSYNIIGTKTDPTKTKDELGGISALSWLWVIIHATEDVKPGWGASMEEIPTVLSFSVCCVLVCLCAMIWLHGSCCGSETSN